MLHRLRCANVLSLLRPLTTGAVVCGLVIGTMVGLQALPASAQPGAAAPAVAPAPRVVVSKPYWTVLSAEQQAALQPLAPYWNGISEPQKRKWLALSRNYTSMTSEDKATLHSRMTDWASLSAQQRAQARLNFAEVKQLPVDERKAKWEAYQALSDDEKRKLADSARSARPATTATPVRPVPARKLAPVPVIPSTLVKGEHTPRIQLAPPPPPPAAVSPSVSAPPVALPVTSPPLQAPAPATAAQPPVPAEAQVPAPGGAAPSAAP